MSSSRFCFCLFVVLCCFVSFTAAKRAADPTESSLPPDVLHHLLFVEPTQHIQALGNVSDLEGTLKRTFLRPGHRRAAKILQRWMVEGGMLPWLDAVGNVRGRTSSSRSGSALMIGSHYDTVIDGGKYDGALGIIVGIAAVKTVLIESAVSSGFLTGEELSKALQSTDAGVGRLDLRQLLSQAPPLLRHPVEVSAFSDEEGVRFQSTFLGSLALAGQVYERGLLDARDADGTTLREALEEAGMDTSPEGFKATSLHPSEVDGYIEVHIEQGPVLQSVGRRLGAVSAIAGQTRLLASLMGKQGHAGTVPMRLRFDPLAAAAELIAELERICDGGRHAGPSHYSELANDDSLVCTVGSISLWPNASNVIPARTNFTIDIRSRSDEKRLGAVAAFDKYMNDMCERRGLECVLDKRHEAPAIHCDERMVSELTRAIKGSEKVLSKAMEYKDELKKVDQNSDAPGSCSADSTTSDCSPSSSESNNDESAPSTKVGSPPYENGSPVLVSGAGHDAMVLSNLTRMGMVFVRCKDGISHSPEEYVEPEDVAAAVAALYQYIKEWVNR